jgi:hypothetical protein
VAVFGIRGKKESGASHRQEQPGRSLSVLVASFELAMTASMVAIEMQDRELDLCDVQRKHNSRKYARPLS